MVPQFWGLPLICVLLTCQVKLRLLFSGACVVIFCVVSLLSLLFLFLMTIQPSWAMHLFICLVCIGSGWACQDATTHTQTITHTHTHGELPTTVLIVKTVCQSSGEIKGKKERGRWVRGGECNSQRPSLHRLKCISLPSFFRHREKAIR